MCSININKAWIPNHIPFLCNPKCHANAATNIAISGSKFKAYHDKVLCLKCMHTARNSMHFVGQPQSLLQKQKYAIWNTVLIFALSAPNLPELMFC